MKHTGRLKNEFQTASSFAKISFSTLPKFLLIECGYNHCPPILWRTSMRVLLVEDDAMIAQAVSANLKDAGYAVDWVSRGSEVAAAVAAQAYDLLLLDLGLPGKDGLDVLAQIRNGGCTVPVLIVTARDDLHSRLNGLDGGADDYIVKPFDMVADMEEILTKAYYGE